MRSPRSVAAQILVQLSVLFAFGAPRAQADEAAWFDPAPLLASMRPNMLELAKDRVAHPEQLPYYRLSIEPSSELDRFRMTETIYLTQPARAPRDEIVLRLNANALAQKQLVRLTGGTCAAPRSCRVTSPEPHLIVVHPDAPLKPGDQVKVELTLEGVLETVADERLSMSGQTMEQMQAMMGSGHEERSFGTLAHGQGLSYFAYFYPVRAPLRDGAYDKDADWGPGDVGNHELSFVCAKITVPQEVRVAASGVEMFRKDGKLEVISPLARDFAFVMSRRYEVLSGNVGDVVVRSYYRRGSTDRGRRILTTAKAALEYFEHAFGPYQLRDLDVAQAPIVGGAGGVEHSGFVTIASMFYSADGGGMMGQMMLPMLDFVVAHEVAHQYFYGLVGTDARTRPFSDEGLAQYAALMFTRQRSGKEAADSAAMMQLSQPYMLMRMMGKPDGAVLRPSDRFGDLVSYGALVYGKGGLSYRALERALGRRAFGRALRRYVRTYAFEMAPPRGLFDFVIDKGPRRAQARRLAVRWLEETHGDEDIGAGGLPGMGNLPGMESMEGMPNLDGLLKMFPGLKAP